jgi:hypothetical protein
MASMAIVLRSLKHGVAGEQRSPKCLATETAKGAASRCGAARGAFARLELGLDSSSTLRSSLLSSNALSLGLSCDSSSTPTLLSSNALSLGLSS